MKKYTSYLVSERMPNKEGMYKVIFNSGHIGHLLYTKNSEALLRFWKEKVSTWIK